MHYQLLLLMFVCSRLKEYKDTVKLIIFTMSVITHKYSVITTVDGLPYDCTSVLPCPSTLGGVIILTSNSIVYVDAANLSGWAGTSVDSWIASAAAALGAAELQPEIRSLSARHRR